MQKRDYVRPQKKSTSSSKILIFAIIIILLLSAASFLWFLKEKAPTPVQKVVVQPKSNEQSILPSRPEERYSYIRDLETREIAVDDEQALKKFSQLNEKQKALLKERELAEQKRLAEIEKNTTVVTTQNDIEPDINVPKITIQREEVPVASNQTKIEEQKQLEEQQRLAIEKQKLEQQRQIQKEQAQKGHSKPTKRFGVQCGAFKNSDQAENMYARLSMAGFNANVVKGVKWNRVIISPIETKYQAKQIMKKVRPIADCIVIGL